MCVWFAHSHSDLLNLTDWVNATGRIQYTKWSPSADVIVSYKGVEDLSKQVTYLKPSSNPLMSTGTLAFWVVLIMRGL